MLRINSARGLKSMERGPSAIGNGVTAVPTHKWLWAQNLDSSIASLLRNDLGRIEIVTQNSVPVQRSQARRPELVTA